MAVGGLPGQATPHGPVGLSRGSQQAGPAIALKGVTAQSEGTMKSASFAAAAMIAIASTTVIRPAFAQAPCSATRAVVDSARDDVLSILNSGRPLVLELRQEQGIAKPESLSSVVVVNERYVCAKL